MCSSDLYSQATKLPYVKCDEETYNDQAWIFSTEEGIKEFGKKMIEDKILLMGMRFSKKDYPRLYGTFYAIGVNTVVWVDGEDKIEIDLPDVAKQADMSKIEPAKRPLLNPTLELSGIYFMQELRRPVEKDQHGNLRELEEELIVNLKKSEYLVAMNVDPEGTRCPAQLKPAPGDAHTLTADVAGFVAGQESHQTGHLFRLAHTAHGDVA